MIDHSVTVACIVNLILADGANLTITGSTAAGFANNGEGSNLIIYAQSAGDNMGILSVTGGKH